MSNEPTTPVFPFVGPPPSPSPVEKPKPKTQIEHPLAMPFGIFNLPAEPRYAGWRELQAVYDNPNEIRDLTFVGKLGRSLRYDTVIGNFIEDRLSPSFPTEEGFKASFEDLKKYGGDLDDGTLARIESSARSFGEMLLEIDEARTTLRYRKELMKGGFFDKAGGVIATIVSMGGEAVALTALAATAGNIIPGGGLATGSATAMARVNSLTRTLNALKLGAFAGRRAKGAYRAAGISLGVDIPLEAARWSLDKTLSPNDVLIAIGASGTLGGAFGAWKPHLFEGPMRKMLASAERRQAIEYLDETGQTEAAAWLRLQPLEAEIVDPTVIPQMLRARKQVAELEAEAARLTQGPAEIGSQFAPKKVGPRSVLVEPTRGPGMKAPTWAERLRSNELKLAKARDELEVLTRKTTPIKRLTPMQVRREAQRLGIETTKLGILKPDKLLRKELEDVRIRQAAPQMARKQVERNLKRMQQDPVTGKFKPDDLKDLKKMAEDLGVKVTPKMAKSGKELKRAIREATVRAARKGTVAKKVAFKLKSRTALRGATLNKISLSFASDLSHAIYRVGGRSFKGKDELVSSLKEYGIKNPEELGKALRQAIRTNTKGKKPKTMKVDAEKLLGQRLVKIEDQPFDIGRFDFDILKEFGFAMKIDPKSRLGQAIEITKRDRAATEARQAKREAKKAAHAVADAEDEVLTVNGQPITDHEDGVGLIDISVDDLAKKADDQFEEGGKNLSNATGVGAKASRFTKGEHGDLPDWLPGSRAVAWLFNIFTPTHSRLVSKGSELVQKGANLFLEAPVGGGLTVHSLVKGNVQRSMVRLRTGLVAAEKAAKAEGRTLDERNITRLLTMGSNRGNMKKPEALAVQALEDFHKRLFNYAKKNGLMEEEIPDAAGYLHRIWTPTSFTDHGEKELRKFFYEAIIKGRNKYGMKTTTQDKKVAREAARRIVAYGKNPTAYSSHKESKIFLDGVKNDLKIEGFDDADTEAILDAITLQVGREPHQNFAKKRILLDENHVGELGGLQVHIDQFMNRDLWDLTSTYAHRLIGAVETRKGMEALFGAGYAGMPFSKALDTLMEDQAKFLRANRPDLTEHQIKEEVEYVGEAFKATFNRAAGIPLWEVSDRTMRFVLGTQAFAQGTMGQVLGVAQLPEIASIVMRSGVRNALGSFPGLRTLFNTFTMGIRKEAGVRGMDGRLTDKVAAELESFFAIGADYHIGEHLMRRLDDLGVDRGVQRGMTGKFLEAGRKVSLLNPLGIMPMDTFLRRWGTKAHFQNFVNHAYKLKEGKVQLVDTWWKKSRTRFKQLGLDDSELDRVMKALADPEVVQVKKGIFGNYKVLDIDFTKVKDQKAYDMLAMAIRRQIDSTVQRQSMGEIPLWMSNSVGAKLLMQYRVFMMASKGKQLAAGMARADAYEGMNLVGSAMLGYVGYTLLSYGRSLTKPDRERAKFLEEALTTENALKSGFMRSSYSTIFPMLIDGGMRATFNDPFFTRGMRTTGLGANPIEGTVAWGMGEKLLGSWNAAFNSPFTKKDARDLANIAWFLKMPAIKQIYDAGISDDWFATLPDKERRR